MTAEIFEFSKYFLSKTPFEDFIEKTSDFIQPYRKLIGVSFLHSVEIFPS